MTRLAFCSVVTASHAHYAAAVAASVLAVQPGVGYFVLLVDRTEVPAVLKGLPGVTCITLADVLPDAAQRRLLTFDHTAFELCCALKPRLVAHLIERGVAETLVYADSDLHFLAPLPPDALPTAERPFVLTPQCLVPGPVPLDVSHLYFGAFNAGYFAVRAGERSRAMLDFWWSRCEREGRDDRAGSVFVDQGWLDFFPVFFGESLHITRDPGCNVGPWNLHQRALRRGAAGEALVGDGGRPLVFLHWSKVLPPGKASTPFGLPPEWSSARGRRKASRSLPSCMPRTSRISPRSRPSRRRATASPTMTTASRSGERSDSGAERPQERPCGRRPVRGRRRAAPPPARRSLSKRGGGGSTRGAAPAHGLRRL